MKLISNIRKIVVPSRLRVGVVSDSQLTPFRHAEPTTFESNLLAACRTMKECGCNFVVFAGDICNRASKTGYETYKRCFNTAFGADKPVVQSIMGNHDYYAHPCPRRLFERELGQSPFTHYVVNGWHFIGASPDSCSMSRGYARVREWLKREIEEAEADGTDRPVFVTTHNAPRGTVYGSGRWGDDSLVGVFDGHPRVVNFSGHTHYSLLDPRSFWQGSFTAFGTQSLSYTEMEKGKANGSVPPLAHTAPMGYILDFADDAIAVMRYNMLTGEELLPEERIVIPAESAPALSPAARSFAPPVFAEGRAYSVTAEQGTELHFPRAKGAHSYELRFQDGSTQTYFSDFYLGGAEADAEQVLTVYGRAEERGDVTVTAIGPFGDRSAESVTVKDVHVLPCKYRRKFAPEIWY